MDYNTIFMGKVDYKNKFTKSIHRKKGKLKGSSDNNLSFRTLQQNKEK